MTGSIEKMKKAYILAKRYEWEEFGKFFRENKELLDKEIDLHKSTAFHYAAHCGMPSMYKEMLEMVDDPIGIQHVLRLQDDMGNTPLHEVAFVGEVEMTDHILKYNDDSEQFESLLFMKNNLGETPVYRAAALGKTKLLQHFVLNIDLSPHFHRNDSMSILHTAVIDQFFGTALWLLKRYGNQLADLKDDNGLTTLQLLATMPSTFRSQTQMGAFKNFIYAMLPKYQDYQFYQDEESIKRREDLESGEKGINQWSHPYQRNHSEWKGIEKLWRKKEMHKLAEELVRLLAEKDKSWQQTSIATDRTVSIGSAGSFKNERKGKEKKDQASEKQEEKSKDQQKHAEKPAYTPLLMAACNGIMEIVEVIIRFHPQSIEHVSDDEQNILYMAVKHRQLEVYRLLKKLKMVRRLAGKIDKLGNTVLHYTAEFQGGHQPGYALQLQEELHWFERIEKRLPYHYTIHYNKEDNKTAKQLFQEKHNDLLREARNWIKETAQSCSAVAVLVATVVFAAAYTVPGGTDDNGLPRFLHHPIFLVFTIMDVVSLASSLASVVMFLSILTSPCEMWDFRSSLPRKLMAGFAFLFFSMATTMMSFSATVLINIKLEKNKWTSTLTYSAAFFPVSIFAMMQFPLYVAMRGCLRSTLKRLKKITPRYIRNLLKRSKRKKIWDI
ncbi:ankyrin repeat-containing protein ITN1-like isoform X2 [Arachis ipaensis]|uniref:ankyrin repeat-containing protein ITN1-like isoform X2 n=1 Tax=Arachis ipaensis TaxID=130454 RepID=UPI000A2B36F5|nr:ankyrin repeat-containing protein ITN1-like isoform X2 [Arachis ipaensis]XP_029152137.1 ankyrin repeat-containing protein ITN1-like [Arachis hypogaea]